ncbi:MAG: hypothetical protein K9N23_07130, partial [Akkermansiaceae bacterium]|nr:hypothetical protein [Akkermansiaceae bacterium]
MVSSTDLSTAPATWPVWLGNEDIVGAAPENMLSEVPGGGDSKRFFAVVANGLDDPAADPDHDGFTACQSYALGIDLAAPGILPGA